MFSYFLAKWIAEDSRTTYSAENKNSVMPVAIISNPISCIKAAFNLFVSIGMYIPGKP